MSYKDERLEELAVANIRKMMEAEAQRNRNLLSQMRAVELVTQLIELEPVHPDFKAGLRRVK